MIGLKENGGFISNFGGENVTITTEAEVSIYKFTVKQCKIFGVVQNQCTKIKRKRFYSCSSATMIKK